MNNNNSIPIGIFDSGVGGLTVFKEIRRAFPIYDIVYFGDTARVPYGTKSKETIIEYSMQNARFLLQQGVEVIVIACNTASAFALESLQKVIDMPVIGVIDAGAEAALKATRNGKIGVIGTEGTVNSHAYRDAIRYQVSGIGYQEVKNPPCPPLKRRETVGDCPYERGEVEVFEKACPLFVPLAEEGWHEHSVTKQVAEIYLSDLLKSGIDTLVLGCTHYPILKNVIKEVAGESVVLVDSAEAVLEHLRVVLKTPTSTVDTEIIGKDHFYVSDNAEKFARIAKIILKVEEINIERVSI